MVDRVSFRHFYGRIEWHEPGNLQKVGILVVQGCGDPYRGVDRILTAVGTGEGGQHQDAVFVEPRHRVYGGHRKFIARQGTGLVYAEDIQACGFIDRGEPGRKYSGSCQRPRSDGGRKRKCRGQRDRHRGENRYEHQRDDFGQRHAYFVGVNHQQQGDCAVKAGKIAHDPKHRLLLGADDVGGANEFRRASEFGAHSGGAYFGDSFAPPDQGARIGLRARSGLNRQRFAGEHGLIEQDGALAYQHIGGDHRAQRRVSRHRPEPVRPRDKVVHAPSRSTEAFNASRDFSAAMRRLGPALVKEAERSIEYEK